MAFTPRDWGWQPPALTPEYRTTVARAPANPLLRLPPTPSELSGPVFGHGDVAAGDNDLLHNHAAPGQSAIGERIILHGRVVDQDGRPVPGTLIEVWQANAGGRYRHRVDGYLAALDPNFAGCGRVLTGADGAYSFHTVKPGAYPWPNSANSWRPAHIHLSIFGTAFAQRLITQCYFQGDPLIPHCAIVRALPDPAARDRLVARLDLEATVPFDSVAYRFDIVLRGRAATVFENRPEGM
ncbi:protocatechuate 3,4-dioxygenase subunit beta [Jannaschia pohangensis]|nr:protocatechuate 3,4-dioxygenase subunit beta [Jannaschia pohangensis]